MSDTEDFAKRFVNNIFIDTDDKTIVPKEVKEYLLDFTKMAELKDTYFEKVKQLMHVFITIEDNGIIEYGRGYITHQYPGESTTYNIIYQLVDKNDSDNYNSYPVKGVEWHTIILTYNNDQNIIFLSEVAPSLKEGGGESDPRNLESRYVVERYRAEKQCPDEVAKSTVANKIYIF
jgi:hypothetical protein